MSSHPQSVPSGRRAVDTRHLPNPATLPLQLQRAHTVRARTTAGRSASPPAALQLLIRWKDGSWHFGYDRHVFGKQGITVNQRRGPDLGGSLEEALPRFSQVPVFGAQRYSSIRCLSWKFMLLLPHQDPPSLFSATSPNYKDYVGLLIQDKKRLWFKEEASGSCKKFTPWPPGFAGLFVPVWRESWKAQPPHPRDPPPPHL